MGRRLQTGVKIAKILIFAPFFALSIALEDRLKQYFRLRFPRSVEEAVKRPAAFFTIIQQQAPFTRSDDVPRVISRGGPRHEPDKAQSSGIIEVITRVASEERTTPLFLKFQNGRGMPLSLQAIRAAVEWGIAREVEFYRQLAPSVPVCVPRALYADYIPAFNRVCLVLEHVDGLNIPDSRGCPLNGIRAILREVASLNALFLGRTVEDPRTRWIPARAGLEFADYVGDFIKQDEACYQTVWQALQNYFADASLTLVHGDCRPGNMLFVDNKSDSESLHNRLQQEAPREPLDWATPCPPIQVLFLDWEATNAAPLLWDFTYCTLVGLSVADRRRYLDKLLDEFLEHLQIKGVPALLLDSEQSRRDVACLTLVLSFVAHVVRTHGLWDQQGNTRADVDAWTQRISSAVLELDINSVAKALNVPTEPLRRYQALIVSKKSDALTRSH